MHLSNIIVASFAALTQAIALPFVGGVETAKDANAKLSTLGNPISTLSTRVEYTEPNRKSKREAFPWGPVEVKIWPNPEQHGPFVADNITPDSQYHELQFDARTVEIWVPSSSQFANFNCIVYYKDLNGWGQPYDYWTRPINDGFFVWTAESPEGSYFDAIKCWYV